MIVPVDAHHHISVNPVKKSIYNTYDMEGIEKANFISSGLNINIGVHPLFIDSGLDVDRIEQILLDNENINIGEVGLDKRGVRDNQKKVFTYFIGLAKKLDRSVSIHCVKSWGGILDSIKGLDIPMLFHGFNSSRETLKTLLKYNSYFSFSNRELHIPKIRELCKFIPINKQLIESDMMEDEYMKIGHNNYLNLLHNSLDQLSLINSMPPKDFNYIIDDNFKSFIEWRE